MRAILDDVEDSPLGTGRITLATVAVFLAVLLIRPIGVFATTYLRPIQRRREPRRRRVRRGSTRRWCRGPGMRGVVTLAAAFALPEETPHRDVLVLIALIVTVGTLLVQGFSLPTVIRRLGLAGPDPDEDALQAAEIYQRAASRRSGAAGRARHVNGGRRRSSPGSRSGAWSGPTRCGSGSAAGDETPSQAYARLRSEMLDAERGEVLRIRASGSAAHEVLQDVLDALDVEETILARAETTTTAERDEDLRPGRARRGLRAPRRVHPHTDAEHARGL